MEEIRKMENTKSSLSVDMAPCDEGREKQIQGLCKQQQQNKGRLGGDTSGALSNATFSRASPLTGGKGTHSHLSLSIKGGVVQGAAM